MKPLIALALVAPLLGSYAAPATAAGLDVYLWQSRPVLVFARSRNAPQAVDQLKQFEAARSDLSERAMPVLLVTAKAVTTVSGEPTRAKLDAATLREAYAVADGEFAIVLVGKDGGEKLRSARPVEVSELTALVDTMPMRAREAR